ncbi:uncharacterized protein EV154DRAFT_603277 [Mucor mucedo]|uniref:uncharacterized protein n=1 Tax=Mucor mucedo TaxID=29922 RepID=UPI00221F39EC|nr:uncharacterized protein EV154DRAFT_603277 [Mucor mucedo]KAI7890282.1 hypothetical protein EV154DRAFT_603277 [Mucor mucedo]
MVYLSKLPNIVEPKTGLLQFLFGSDIPNDRALLIDALDTSRSLTFAQIKKKVLQFGAGLQDICDFRKGDVMALYSPNEYNYSIPLFGAIAASGITTTANPNYSVEELYYQLDQTKAKVLICHASNLKTALIAGLRAGIQKSNFFVFGNEVVQGVRPFEAALLGHREAVLEELSFEQAKERVALLCFSSGTSGRSKGVMTTHTNLTSNVAQYLELDKHAIDPTVDRMIGILPLFHAFGLTVNLNCALYLGLPLYILPGFELVSFCDTIQKHRITFATVVPPICLLLAKHELVSNYDLSSLRLAICGAAPLSAELGRETMTRLPNLLIRQGYGLTETSPLAVIEPIDKTIDGSTGLLLSNMVAKIIDEDGKEVTKQGERGELWLKGPNVMKGYLNNPEATADCIDNEGYFHTGDIVLLDKDEHFYVVDRKKELIKYKGFQVPPAEIEGILLTNPIIADCAVIGVYDAAQATEIPRAYVTLKDPTTASEDIGKLIMKYVADQVVNYKQVRSIRFIPVIPKNPSGKILRRILREAAQEEDKLILSKL